MIHGDAITIMKTRIYNNYSKLDRKDRITFNKILDLYDKEKYIPKDMIKFLFKLYKPFRPKKLNPIDFTVYYLIRDRVGSWKTGDYIELRTKIYDGDELEYYRNLREERVND